jgi:hypothetical protein
MLAGARLVASRRDGVRIYYRLADRDVSAFVGQVQDFAASRLADAGQAARGYLGDVGALEPVAQDELVRRMNDGRSWCWTCGPRPSTRRGTSPAR